ncbi:EpsG family protein [Helicobacter sp. MIT 99-5507]|uniref:EpsG family protein n=1 Tax=Helicobacter sp. MIT 99-5507 TaxID=152489 RepID=UPI0011C083E4|nr:EpsG family protein [Helicobacter sp. MIT 99-5507]
MIGLSSYITKEYRILLSVNMVFNISMIYGSRIFFSQTFNYDDDFSRYYQNYLDIYDDIHGAMFVNRNGYEIGLPIFYKIISLIFPKLFPQNLLQITTFVMVILFYIWLEIYVIKYIKNSQRAALIAFSLFFSFLMAIIGLTRQGFSCVFLLYAISNKDVRLKLLFLVISCLFHMSSLLVFIGFYIIFKFPKLSLCLFGIFLLLFLNNSYLINTSIIESGKSLYAFLPQQFFEYSTYYIKPIYSFDMFAHSVMKILLYLYILFSFFILNPNDKLIKHYKIPILICFIIYFMQIIPTRFFMVAFDLLFGFLLFLASRKFLMLALILLIPYFLRLMYLLIMYVETSFQGEPLSYFYSYPEYSIYPFYYLFQGVLI